MEDQPDDIDAYFSQVFTTFIKKHAKKICMILLVVVILEALAICLLVRDFNKDNALRNEGSTEAGNGFFSWSKGKRDSREVHLGTLIDGNDDNSRQSVDDRVDSGREDKKNFHMMATDFISRKNIMSNLEYLCKEEHMAGTPEDIERAHWLKRQFELFGLDHVTEK